MSSRIHPTAIIELGAELGDEVEIGPYAYVGAQVRLGERTRLHHHATVTGRTTLGAGNVVHPGAVLGGVPQDLKYKGEDTELAVGDENTFRECATVNIGTAGGGGRTVIGHRCLLMAYSHVAHDCLLADRIVIANGVQLAGHIVVESNAVISGLAAVNQFCTIGRLAYVGGMSGVRQDVPPFLLVDGQPPARVRGLNLVGLKRNGFSDETIESLKSAFRLLYKSESPRAEVLTQLESSPLFAVPEVAELVASLRNSMNGRQGRALEAERDTGNGGVYGAARPPAPPPGE